MKSALEQLARKSDGPARRELMDRVASLFFARLDDLSQSELVLFGDVLSRLLGDVSTPDKIRFSLYVAKIPQTPNHLARTLAEDDYRVAAPILQHSQALTTQDLLAIARRKGQPYLMAMAVRPDLNEQVTDALIERGENLVLRKVTENKSARLTDWAFRTLVARGRQDKQLLNAVSRRPDITREACERLLPHVSGSARERLQAVLDGNLEHAEELFIRADWAVAEIKRDLDVRRIDGRDLYAMIDAGKTDLEELIGILCEENRLRDVSSLLAAASGRSEKTARKCMYELDTRPLAKICRELDLADVSFRLLCKARCHHLNLPMSQVAHWIQIYREMGEQN
ncbi:MAG: DUF2336 domain-containing protein [Stappiaceae bacterium]